MFNSQKSWENVRTTTTSKPCTIIIAIALLSVQFSWKFELSYDLQWLGTPACTCHQAEQLVASISAVYGTEDVFTYIAHWLSLKHLRATKLIARVLAMHSWQYSASCHTVPRHDLVYRARPNFSHSGRWGQGIGNSGLADVISLS